MNKLQSYLVTSSLTAVTLISLIVLFNLVSDRPIARVGTTCCEVSPSPTPNPSPSPTPTVSPSPTPTPVPTPTPSPTPAPTPTPSPTPTPGPTPSPSKAKWEQNMETYGVKACNYYKGNATYDEKLGAMYYDALRVNHQIRVYKNDTKWDSCIQAILPVWRDKYVIGNNGTMPGYWNFGAGLRNDYEKTNAAASKDGLRLLQANASYCADTTDHTYVTAAYKSREVAYCMETKLDWAALGNPLSSYYTFLVPTAKDHMDQWFVSKTARMPPEGDVPACVGKYYIQPFMVALTMHALWREHERQADPQIVSLNKTAADWLIANAWVAADESFWYDNCVDNPSQPMPAKPGAPDLNLIIYTPFVKLWKATGDIKYRDMADKMFKGGVDRAFLDGQKQFNQNYLWSFEGVQLRGN